MNEYKIDGQTVEQIRLPAPGDDDPHPRLMFRGYGLHAGEVVTAWLPGVGFVDLMLEVSWSKTGPACWYVSTEGYTDICPVGLWCSVR